MYGSAARQGDHGLRQILNCLLARERSDRLLATADLATSACHIDLRRPELAIDVARSDAKGQQPIRIESDADFALDAADTLDFRNAAHALQRPRKRVIDEPGQLLGCH